MPLIFHRLQTIGLSFIASKLKKPTCHFGFGPVEGCGLSFFAGLHRHAIDKANQHAWDLKDKSPEMTETDFLASYFTYRPISLLKAALDRDTALRNVNQVMPSLENHLILRHGHLDMERIQVPFRRNVQKTSRHYKEQDGYASDENSPSKILCSHSNDDSLHDFDDQIHLFSASSSPHSQLEPSCEETAEVDLPLQTWSTDDIRIGKRKMLSTSSLWRSSHPMNDELCDSGKGRAKIPGMGICGPFSLALCVTKRNGRASFTFTADMAISSYQCCANGFTRMLEQIHDSECALGSECTDAEIFQHWLSSASSGNTSSLLALIGPRTLDPDSHKRVGLPLWTSIQEGIYTFTRSFQSVKTVPQGILSKVKGYITIRRDIQLDQIQKIQSKGEVLPTLDDISTWWDPFDMGAAAYFLGFPLAVFEGRLQSSSRESYHVSFNLVAASSTDVKYFGHLLGRKNKRAPGDIRIHYINDITEYHPRLITTTAKFITPIIVLFQDRHFEAIVDL